MRTLSRFPVLLLLVLATFQITATAQEVEAPVIENGLAQIIPEFENPENT